MCSSTPDVPLLALANLAPLRMPRVVGILARIGRVDDRRIHNRSGAELKAHLHLLFAFRNSAAPRSCCSSNRRSFISVVAPAPAHSPGRPPESAKRRAVQHRFLARVIGQIESVL